MAEKNKDIFAPPSEKELNDLSSDSVFAAPSAEELESETTSSTLGDFATGVHRGAMMGGAEELAGVGTAIGEKVADTDTFQKLSDWYQGYKTNASPQALEVAASAQPSPEKTWYESYRKGQQEAQAVSDAARKASPWAYGAGQVVGGLTTGIAASPLAAAAPMTTAVGTGALAGGLESEATIEQPLELTEDIALGGAFGGILQKILPSGVKKPQKDILQRGEFMPQLETAAKMGEEGISLSKSPEARQALTQRLQQSERDLASKFIEPRKTLGKALEQPLREPGRVLIQSADDLAALKSIEEIISLNSSAIGQKQARELLQKTQQMQQGLLDPYEAYKLRQEIGSIVNKIADPENKQIVKTGADSIKNMLEESVPDFKGRLGEFAQFAEAGPEALLSKGFDPDVADVFLGDLSKGELKISEKVRDLLSNIRSGGAEGLKKQGEFFAAMKELEGLAQENPELVKKLGIDPAKLTREFLQKADEAAVAQKVAGEGVAQSVYERGKFGLRKASEAGLLKTANVYGQAKKSVRDFVQAGKEELQSAAQALQQYGGPDLQSLAEILSSEVPQKRNAAIFSILQLPKAKEILGIESGD